MFTALRKRASQVLLLPVLLLSMNPTGLRANPAASGSSSTDYPAPGGLRWYKYYDSDCINDGGAPDAYVRYEEYWNEDASFNYDVARGHSTYWCQLTTNVWDYRGGDAPVYCSSYSPWNCQELATVEDYHP